jgi:Iodothyronine deiodinase
MVYVREAHPTDGWRTSDNDRPGVVGSVATIQPRTYDERAGVAQTCGKLLGLAFPMVVDTIDDRAGNLYSGMPGRLYVIDREGKVAFKSGRGPYLFKPAELEQSLVLLLQEKTATGNQADASTKVGGGIKSGSTGGAIPATN